MDCGQLQCYSVLIKVANLILHSIFVVLQFYKLVLHLLASYLKASFKFQF